MRKLFYKGAIHPEQRVRVEALAQVIRPLAPHLLGIVEASDRAAHHHIFLNATGLNELGYQVAKSTNKRQKQDLVFYYREPLRLLSLDDQFDFYADWIEDIDEDGIKELCSYERRPLEALFELGETGERLRVILVSSKSKGVFSVNDLKMHEHLALANRKRQLAQIKKLRERVEELLDMPQREAFVILGDFNDEPGLDSFQRVIGASTIETIMGSVFAPQRILYNALWHMNSDRELQRQLWTTEYPDLIVHNLRLHRGWLDHILTSPSTLEEGEGVRLVACSGRVGEKNDTSRLASDHYPVYCDFQVGAP